MAGRVDINPNMAIRKRPKTDARKPARPMGSSRTLVPNVVIMPTHCMEELNQNTIKRYEMQLRQLHLTMSWLEEPCNIFDLNLNKSGGMTMTIRRQATPATKKTSITGVVSKYQRRPPVKRKTKPKTTLGMKDK
jgi:hypothetical protein